MLAIVSSDKKYFENLLEKLDIEEEKEYIQNKIYKCDYKGHKFVIMSLGYGKINIGSSLRYLCDNYKIKAIIVMGTAGSVTNLCNLFTAVIPNNSLQFDVDFIPLGYKAAQIPKLLRETYSTNSDLNECLKKASNICAIDYTDLHIATSDMFVCNYNLSNSIRREYNASCVDTETGSIGEFCYINSISYASVKVISNFADNNAKKQHDLYNEEACNICQRIVYKFLKIFYDE